MNKVQGGQTHTDRRRARIEFHVAHSPRPCPTQKLRLILIEVDLKLLLVVLVGACKHTQALEQVGEGEDVRMIFFMGHTQERIPKETTKGIR